MSKARERSYERRRYEEWQTKLNDRKRRRRQLQRVLLAALSSLAAIGVIVAVALVVTSEDDDDAGGSAAGSTPSATPSASSPAATPSAAAVKGGCTPSTVKPVASPKQTSKVPAKSTAAGKTFTVTLKTTCGDIVLTLDGRKAPQAVASTVALARSGFYDGSPCHRLTTSGIYVLQCGDPTGSGSGGPGYTYGPLENVGNGKMPAGTIAMARASAQDSQGSQFFLVYKATELSPAETGGGYTVIGKITKGLSVVDKVAKAGVSGGSGDGAPATPISVLSTKVTQG